MDTFYVFLFLSSCLAAKGTSEADTRFLLFSLKNGEGFNLARDVYVRAAVLVKELMEERNEEWVVVLPPWPHLYHWKSRNIPQDNVKWEAFFDLASLNEYVPVIEFEEYVRREGRKIEKVIRLQLPPTINQELLKIVPCTNNSPYTKSSSGAWTGSIFGVSNVAVGSFNCLEVLGFAKTLKPELIRRRSVLVEKMDVVMHNDYNGVEYWLSRASMVYAKPLREAGSVFIKAHFGYDPESKSVRDTNLIGGNYLSVHLRREDFKRARPETVPSLQRAAEQINRLKKIHGLDAVFLATDAPNDERLSLAELVDGLVWYSPTQNMLRRYGDGGVAIIDQWIASHAKFFVGTTESTFSFRIREDRKLMGFSMESTYNNLCGDKKVAKGKEGNQMDCSKATRRDIPREALLILAAKKRKSRENNTKNNTREEL